MRTKILTTLALCAVGLTACSSDDRDNPGITPNNAMTSAQLVGFQSCAELELQLKGALSARLENELRMQTDNYHRGGWMEDDMAAESADASADSGGNGSAPADGGREEGVDFSGTNNQEEGVDEADFVKTDGYHIYTLNGNRLEIFSVPNFGDLVHQSTAHIEGRPNQMLLEGDKMVIYSMIYPWELPENHPVRELIGQEYNDQWQYWYWRVQALTKVTVIDMTDRQNPMVARQLYLEGQYQTGRKVGQNVRMVSHAWMNLRGVNTWPVLPDDYWQYDYDSPEREAIWEQAISATIESNNAMIASYSLDDLVPRLYERLLGNEFVEHTYTSNSCANFSIPEDGNGMGFTSILSLDLFDSEFAFEADHLLTNWSHVYASTDTLVIAEPAQDWWWFWGNTDADEATNIHRFDISEGINTVYAGSGRVPGMIQGQFSLSEHNDFIRVASTTGRWNRWWEEDPEPSVSHVYVLGEGTTEDNAITLNVVGHVGDIAPGERLWSSRFVGDEGYLVTFRNIDPLWTIDLSDPTHPEVKGELEVPGVSTYIHPLKSEQDGFLLTIGYGGDNDGLDWNTQVSLFDVTDFENPQIASALPMSMQSGDGWYYSWSEANYEHKAFQYWAPKELLAIPLSTYRWIYDEESHNYHYEYSSLLQLVSVDVESGLSLYGTIDHSDFFNSDTSWYWNYRDVRRSIFMGDYIYAISDRGITAHTVEGLQLSASYQLPGSTNYDYWDCGTVE